MDRIEVKDEQGKELNHLIHIVASSEAGQAEIEQIL